MISKVLVEKHKNKTSKLPKKVIKVKLSGTIPNSFEQFPVKSYKVQLHQTKLRKVKQFLLKTNIIKQRRIRRCKIIQVRKNLGFVFSKNPNYHSNFHLLILNLKLFFCNVEPK